MPELDDGIETRCVIITGSEGMFSAGYDIGDIPDEVFAEEAERLVAHPFSRAIEAVEAFPVPDARGDQRARARRRPRAGAHLRPADRRQRREARHAAGQARPDLQPHRPAEVHRHGRPGAHARAVLHRAATSTPTGRSRSGSCNEVVAARGDRRGGGRAGGRDRGKRACFAEGQQGDHQQARDVSRGSPNKRSRR